MGKNPFNLGLRFILEIMAFVGIGLWGWTMGDGWLKYFLAAGLVIMVALLWGVFAVPNDPSRSGKTVVVTPGWIRLLLELAIFGFAALAYYNSGYPKIALGFGIAAVVHYVLSYDRVMWLFKQ